MKPDWDKLGDKYAASSSVVIGDVDCTVHQDLCGRFDVKGYPTIKYFNTENADGAAYQGGRSYGDLETFVEDNLAAKCAVDDQEGCSDREKKYIAKRQAKDAEANTKELGRLNGMKGDSMKPELKAWLLQRVAILEQL